MNFHVVIGLVSGSAPSSKEGQLDERAVRTEGWIKLWI